MYSIVLHLPIDCHHKLGPTVKLQLEQNNQRKGDISGCTGYSIVLHLPIDCHHKLGPTVWAEQELDLIRKLQLEQNNQRKGDISGCTVLYYIYL
jgi:hypothetical protein